MTPATNIHKAFTNIVDSMDGIEDAVEDLILIGTTLGYTEVELEQGFSLSIKEPDDEPDDDEDELPDDIVDD